MQRFTKFCLGVFTTSSLFLTGCQHYQKPNTGLTPTVNTDDATQPSTQFELQGKIGVRTPQQSGSAFFTWLQQQDHFEIDLSGALGIGKTHIEGTPGSVTLNSAKTGTITATTAEELLEKATGWQTPITHLVQWVQAKPATSDAQVQSDAEQRPIQIIEDDWNVSLSYKDDAKLPNKLVLQQNLENGQQNRITMVIQNR
ncbi:lipoprotein insertase outer membrane protein LolB [Acinetobacter sp. MD2(2019)]|uniref:lipoprotein insertase outer membrane protein LolB n=1 Tax=Acinetobacter sp. MD2(2019) TaxID=2605273 RepID=UPI002D1F6899|nr:lipoprotein insertase outer membrane protein LolB [Acinetobacter sp. MD2(2019)]MEB3753360.1 outer membrane lipoprotein LolB [Acinetobacter sp. MD2(2019)]